MSVTSTVSFKVSAILAAAGIGALMIASGALAQATSSRMKGMQLSNDKPIQIESDKLEIKDPESKAIFTGNVKVVQGTTTLQAGNMTVFYKAGGGSISGGNADIDRIEVSNKVFLNSGVQQATADTGAFDLTRQTLVLKGDKVVLSEGKNVFVGCQLNVQMDTGEAQLEACGGRVQIQLDPQSRKQN
jgi:lipopolysaccharide export system protein LptA